MNDTKKELRLHFILAIIWTVNAVLWAALFFESLADGGRSELIVRAVTAACFALAAVLGWVNYARRKKQ